MTEPCRHTEKIEGMSGKIDAIHEIVIEMARQDQRIQVVEKATDDQEIRIRVIEGRPSRILWWCLGIVSTILSGIVLSRLIP